MLVYVTIFIKNVIIKLGGFTIKKKIGIGLVVLLIGVGLIVYRGNFKGIFKNNDNNLTKSELTQIKTSVKSILDTNYEMMKTWKFKSNKDLIKDDKLLELVETNSKFKSQWYPKVNLKANYYKSSLNIEDIKMGKDDKCMAKIKYEVEFKLNNTDRKSSSLDEKYVFELKKDKTKWYITKMLTYEDMKSMRKDLVLKLHEGDSYKYLEDEKKYYQVINSNINNIKNVLKNIDKYAEKKGDQIKTVK